MKFKEYCREYLLFKEKEMIASTNDETIVETRDFKEYTLKKVSVEIRLIARVLVISFFVLCYTFGRNE